MLIEAVPGELGGHMAGGQVRIPTVKTAAPALFIGIVLDLLMHHIPPPVSSLLETPERTTTQPSPIQNFILGLLHPRAGNLYVVAALRFVMQLGSLEISPALIAGMPLQTPIQVATLGGISWPAPGRGIWIDPIVLVLLQGNSTTPLLRAQ